MLAADGAPMPSGRILGRVVECDNYQDAKRFLVMGGEKGRQLGIITAGTYRINTVLFNVITSENAVENGMAPMQLQLHHIESDKVGIVTTLDGQPIDQGEIAGTVIADHANFQSAQEFREGGGRRGLQEQILLSGTWNLNPWFVQVEQVPMVEIPIGHVGVVISFVGMAHEDVSGVEFKHGDLVNVGHKGVWVTPLYPGKHPVNTRIMRIERVPTTNIVLNWASRTESHNYDAKLSSITVRSPRDGFAFNLDVAQIIPRRRARRAEGDLESRIDAKPGRSCVAADCRELLPQLGAELHGAGLPERSQRAAGRSGPAYPGGVGYLRRAGHRHADRGHQPRRRR